MIPKPKMESFALSSIRIPTLAPGRNRAQFLAGTRYTQVRGKTHSYDLKFKRATADPLYVVYVQMIGQNVLAAVSSPTSAMLGDWKMPQRSSDLEENSS